MLLLSSPVPLIEFPVLIIEVGSEAQGDGGKPGIPGLQQLGLNSASCCGSSYPSNLGLCALGCPTLQACDPG